MLAPVKVTVPVVVLVALAAPARTVVPMVPLARKSMRVFTVRGPVPLRVLELLLTSSVSMVSANPPVANVPPVSWTAQVSGMTPEAPNVTPLLMVRAFNQGQPTRTGRILATEFVNNGKPYSAVWFESKDGQGYYTAEGKNIRKAFLRSPLEFSRVTSGFSHSRFHPIHQTWRAHKGVDYGAPIGTRIKATGDGVVEFAGKQGGYGNLVVIRHQGRFTTHYGHLNGFAAGIRKGARVNQGDIVGYVGKTGWATGPHLHYEFRINNVHQNPLAVALPSAPPLTPQQMAEFKLHAGPLVYRLEQIRGMNLALLD